MIRISDSYKDIWTLFIRVKYLLIEQKQSIKMNDDSFRKCTAANPAKDCNILYWILGTICMPIAAPLVVLNLWRRFSIAKERKRFSGKVALITGASSGLGEALAHTFYKAGCKVILAARRVEELERVKKDLLSLEVVGNTYPPIVLPMDLADLNAIKALATKAVNIYNGIDILINNGGISVRADILSTSLDVDLKVMTVNYFGSVALTKAILPSMVKRQTGHICFVSSVQGKFALPHRSAYSASKHAIQAFSDSLRSEVASKGLKVTCINPGYIKTRLSVNALTSTGEQYGKMDSTTAKGMSADFCAKRILESLLNEEKEVFICDMQSRVAFWLRIICPSLYYWIMEKRALKLNNEN